MDEKSKKKFNFFEEEIKNLKRLLDVNADKSIFNSGVMPFNQANLDALTGKKVIIEAVSPYNKLSMNLVVTERIEGKVVKVDNYGIVLKDATKSIYTNGKLTRKDEQTYKEIMVYHNIINYIISEY